MTQGERFGYDYSIHIQRAEVWGQAEYSGKKVDVYAAISLSGIRMWRNGAWANGKFPENSKGESEKLNFSNYGFKFGATYKLNGRNFIGANVAILSRAPEATNVFVSPRVRNDVVQDIQNEELNSFDLNYMVKYPNLKLRFTLYHTQIKDQTWLRTYWDDNYNTNVNLIMTNLNQQYSGMEIGIEKLFSPFIASRPLLVSDNSFILISHDCRPGRTTTTPPFILTGKPILKITALAARLNL